VIQRFLQGLARAALTPGTVSKRPVLRSSSSFVGFSFQHNGRREVLRQRWSSTEIRAGGERVAPMHGRTGVSPLNTLHPRPLLRLPPACVRIASTTSEGIHDGRREVPRSSGGVARKESCPPAIKTCRRRRTAPMHGRTGVSPLHTLHPRPPLRPPPACVRLRARASTVAGGSGGVTLVPLVLRQHPLVCILRRRHDACPSFRVLFARVLNSLFVKVTTWCVSRTVAGGGGVTLVLLHSGPSSLTFSTPCSSKSPLGLCLAVSTLPSSPLLRVEGCDGGCTLAPRGLEHGGG
jgi:hypothetical protein